MKKNYTRPNIELVNIDNEDIFLQGSPEFGGVLAGDTVTDYNQLG